MPSGSTMETTMLQYEFMRIALIVGILLAIAVPIIGVTVVLKRLSMIGDALSHASMAGILVGLLLNFNPILGAMLISLIAALSIEFIRKRFERYAELSIAIITSAGLGLAAVLLGFVSNATNFNSFLFGSIVSITTFEFIMVIVVTFMIIGVALILYRSLFFMAFDEEAAKLSGIKTGWINLIFTILTALVVSLASRTVGALIVSSLMVIPVTCSLVVGRSYLQVVLYSALFGVFFMIAGLMLSFYQGVKSGGSIVMVGIVTLVVLMVIKGVMKRIKA